METQKFLGVTFDNKLSWKPHILNVVSKLNSCLGATRRARPFLNESSLLTIYNSLMKSHIDYCCTTWASWRLAGNKVLLQRLQAICNKFFRMIYGLERTTSVRSILSDKNVLNVNQMYDFRLAQLMHKARASLLPNPIQNLFQVGIFRPCLFKIKPSRIIQTGKSICHSGPRFWNSIPQSITQELEFSKFKSELKKHMLG